MSKAKWKKWEFYEVHWDDIVTDQGWTNEDGEKLPVAKCRSHGYLTDHRPGKSGYIRLSGTVGDNQDGSALEYNQHIVIPLGCITQFERKEKPGV